MASREILVKSAKVAEQCERFDDMKEYLFKAVLLDPILSKEERKLLATAFKNLVGPLRSGLRLTDSIRTREEISGNSPKAVDAVLEKITKDIHHYCNEILELISKYLLPAAEGNEPKVFFLKMQGDCNRYLFEAKSGDRVQLAKKAKLSYQQALDVARSLATTNPIRLGLALNFAVFHYEIMMDSEQACEVAKQAFDNAVTELDQVSDEEYKDCTIILQLIKDNLSKWMEEINSRL